jgi:lipoate-protein ligase A
MADARPGFRVIDTGLRTGRANIAFDQAMIEARATDHVPDTIRFLRFRPAALVGRHQILSHEVDTDYCRAHGIEVGRRITGGGAIYLDEGQIGWELVFRRASLGLSDLDTAARRICEAAAAGLRQLNIAAAYRPRNDIEVDGRKLCGTGGFFDGEFLFYQGTLLIDFDTANMFGALRLPAAKLAKRGIASVAERMVTLRELLGDAVPDISTIQAALLAGFTERLGLRTELGAASDHEEVLARRLLDEEIGTDAFVFTPDAPPEPLLLTSATLTRPGGSVRVDLHCDASGQIRDILITGDFFVTPPRIIRDLEAALRGIAQNDAGVVIDRFLAERATAFLGLEPADLRDAVLGALSATQRPDVPHAGRHGDARDIMI